MPSTPEAIRPFVHSRTFDAPREVLFTAFSTAPALRRWWGPKGFDLDIAGLDFRPGGFFHYAMRSKGGHEMWGRFDYREIVAPERVVYVSSFSNPEGEVIRAPFGEVFPLRLLNEVTYTAENGRTTVTVTSTPFDATPEEVAFFQQMTSSMEAGYGGTMDQLEIYLDESAREIAMSRTYRAPVGRVFAAFSDPGHITHWWGPRGFSTTTHSMDFREGGEWRFTMHGPDGRDYENLVVYREIVPERRLAYHHKDPNGGIAFDVVIDFAPVDTGTEIRFRSLFASREMLAEVSKFGAVEGLADTLSRLGERVEA